MLAPELKDAKGGTPKELQICGQADDDPGARERLFRAVTLIILRKKTAQCSSSRS
jgi:hypothetical protein